MEAKMVDLLFLFVNNKLQHNKVGNVSIHTDIVADMTGVYDASV